MTTLKRAFLVPAVATVFLLITAPGSQAQERSDSGNFTFGITSSEEMALGNGQTLIRTVQSGMVFAADPASPMNQTATTCSGSSVMAAGEAIVGVGYCDSVDQDGDVWTAWYASDQSGGNWGFMSGTGKFEGVEGGGTFGSVAQWPDGRGINSWEATYTLR